jgi:predicted transposase/invertase (TIGR01784 family)
MKFINPITDYAFKKIFSSDDSTDILISFLNAILYEGENIIQTLTIINPYAPGRVSALKTSYFDVKATLQSGENVCIEMQAFNIPAFSKRIMYYAAKAYSNQLLIGEDYPDLRPLISVVITDFIWLKTNQNTIAHFTFTEKSQKFPYPQQDIELVCVELPRFTKSLEELESLADKWLYFLRKAPDLEIVPEIMASISAIDQAFTIAERINLSPEEMEDLENRERFIREQKGALEFAKAESQRQGREQGQKEGQKEGREQGQKEGIRIGQLNLIKQLLQGQLGELNQDIENSLAPLSSEELTALAQAIFSLSSIADLQNWLKTK